MNYLRDRDYNFSQTKKTGWKKPAFFAFLVLVVYFWGSSFLVNLSTFIVYPYLKISGQISQNLSDSLKTQRTLLAENKKLKIDNATLRSLGLRVNELQAENSKLRGLRTIEDASQKSIFGRVILKPNHLPYDEIIIDIGKEALPDIYLGQLIFADSEIVLGQIELVTDHYSKIKLYSTGGVKIPVTVGETAVPSIAEGLGAGNFSLTVPRGVNIKVGDRVKTSIVGNYTLGYVANVIKNVNDPFQKIIFRSPYNMFELEWVQLFSNQKK